MPRRKQPYKEPVFLFTSGSLRHAAWAGWYSAFGDKKEAETFIHYANTEWVKEVSAMRRFSFTDRYNHDIWKYIPPERLNKMLEGFWKEIKKEIKNGKKRTQN